MALSREDNFFWKALIVVQKVVMVVTGITVMSIVSSAMLLRWLFNTDFKGYEEILVMFAFWLYMIGSSYGSYKKNQITADILDIYLKEGRVKSVIHLVRSFATMVLSGVFMYWAYEFVAWSIQMKTKTPVWRLPMVWGQSSLLIGLILVTFYNIVYFYDEIRLTITEFKRKDKLPAGLTDLELDQKKEITN
jgi:TRAP-type C4-dicarboxylate transport system permease small subunit